MKDSKNDYIRIRIYMHNYMANHDNVKFIEVFNAIRDSFTNPDYDAFTNVFHRMKKQGILKKTGGTKYVDASYSLTDRSRKWILEGGLEEYKRKHGRLE